MNITLNLPKKILCVDNVSLERSKVGEENLFVIIDHLSLYATIATKKQTTKTTLRMLFNNFIVHYALWHSGTHSQRPRAELRIKADQEAVPDCEIARV